MHSLRNEACGLLVIVSGLFCATAQGQTPITAPETQHYSQWFYSPARDYWYMYHYFKDQKADDAFRKELVIWEESHPDQLLFYNLKTKKFWGGLNLKAKSDDGRYVKLPPAVQQSGLEETFQLISTHSAGPLPAPGGSQIAIATPETVAQSGIPQGVPHDTPMVTAELPTGVSSATSAQAGGGHSSAGRNCVYRYTYRRCGSCY